MHCPVDVPGEPWPHQLDIDAELDRIRAMTRFPLLGGIFDLRD
jgi:hypothetical protein